MPTTKRENGNDFPAAAFAYVPEPDTPSTWKLRLWEDPDQRETPAQVGRAIAALGSGFRGQKVDIPNSDLPGVKAKVRSAWKKANPDAKPSEMPDSIKASEGDFLVLIDGMNTRLDAGEPFGTIMREYTAVAFADTADEPATAASYDSMRVFLSKLRDLLKGKVDTDVFNNAVKTARSHAGGKAPKTRTAFDVWSSWPQVPGWDDTEYGGDPDMMDGGGMIQYPKADPRINYRNATQIGTQCSTCAMYCGMSCSIVEGRIEADDVCDMFLTRPSFSDRYFADTWENDDDLNVVADMIVGDTEVTPAERRAIFKWLKGDNAALDKYLSTTEPSQFSAGGNVQVLITTFGKWAGGSEATCAKKLAGKVQDPNRLCAWLKDRWSGSTKWRGQSEAGWQLFMEVPQGFAEAPDWIPYLPKPGSYKHPKWGTIDLGTSRIGDFVSKFNAGVYQSRIPVDAEHDTKLSGAFAWITGMRQNADGSADAQVEWTDRGRLALDGGRYKYISPEWFESWTDPVSGSTVTNVAIGAALTTRPFFKDSALRPLVATEGTLYAYEQATGTDPIAKLSAFTEDDVPSRTRAEDVRQPVDRPPKGDPMSVGNTPVGMTEDQQRAFDELTARMAAAEQDAQTKATLLTQASEKIATMEQEARRRRFTEVASGRQGANDGAPWIGPIDTHVAMMEHLADTVGEDSDLYKRYVETARSNAEVARSSGLFTAVGFNGGGDNPTSAWGKIQAAARALTEVDKSLTQDAAVQRVMTENPDLYTAYVNEHTR